VLQKSIAEKQKISNKYLDHIILALRSEGLIVKSAHKNKGYNLARPIDSITTYDIYKAFFPDLSVTPCANRDIDCDCEHTNECVVLKFWAGLNDTIINYMKSHTLADIIHAID